jgi:hypothetical protein
MADFNALAALVAGLAGTIVMTAMMTVASKAGMTRMPPMPLVMGSMMSGDRHKAMVIGGMLHYIVTGTPSSSGSGMPCYSRPSDRPPGRSERWSGSSTASPSGWSSCR